jgi:hypothetical protein
VNTEQIENSLLVKTAHQLLKEYVPGAAFDGEPFMVPLVGTLAGKPMVAANCFYHTVLFVSNLALFFYRDEGFMIPWIEVGNEVIPNAEYFDKSIRLPEGIVDRIYSEMQQIAEQRKPVVAV